LVEWLKMPTEKEKLFIADLVVQDENKQSFPTHVVKGSTILYNHSFILVGENVSSNYSRRVDSFSMLGDYGACM